MGQSERRVFAPQSRSLRPEKLLSGPIAPAAAATSVIGAVSAKMRRSGHIGVKSTGVAGAGWPRATAGGLLEYLLAVRSYDVALEDKEWHFLPLRVVGEGLDELGGELWPRGPDGGYRFEWNNVDIGCDYPEPTGIGPLYLCGDGTVTLSESGLSGVIVEPRGSREPLPLVGLSHIGSEVYCGIYS
jgi:hypothetical protein